MKAVEYSTKQKTESSKKVTNKDIIHVETPLEKEER